MAPWLSGKCNWNLAEQVLRCGCQCFRPHLALLQPAPDALAVVAVLARQRRGLVLVLKLQLADAAPESSKHNSGSTACNGQQRCLGPVNATVQHGCLGPLPLMHRSAKGGTLFACSQGYTASCHVFLNAFPHVVTSATNSRASATSAISSTVLLTCPGTGRLQRCHRHPSRAGCQLPSLGADAPPPPAGPC